ncbi:hypothetical protein [Amycolatopsis sp. CA-230715]|uniref:hypothetical protein n=1 Tax=Amycolatopsis sp. CA-230715 TaxID=2745196 RepID=UPI001C012913|nr:hypothetical protein [Amycolatopsis sp. CA-230715]QWF80451.1 hypothetical protein HUW46_03873 [Amycolatopsis sp. CA-230715]
MLGNIPFEPEPPNRYAAVAAVLAESWHPAPVLLPGEVPTDASARVRWLFTLADAIEAAGWVEEAELVRDRALAIVIAAADAVAKWGDR